MTFRAHRHDHLHVSHRLLLLATSVCLPLLLKAGPAAAQLADPADSGFSATGAPTADSSNESSGPPALTPPTDTLLPRTGIDPADTSLRSHLMSAFGNSASATGEAPQTGLVVYKQIGVSETWTDNAGYRLGLGRDVGDDFITSIQPAVRLEDNTQRLVVNITYDPVAQIYARNSGFTQFEEQGSGDILATLLPEWLYVDLRGNISQQSVFGGFGPATTVELSPDERETISSFSVSPYLSHTFGGHGTVEAGVGYAYSAVDASKAINQELNYAGNTTGLGDYGSSYLNTERVFASYTTGEDLGRLKDRIGTDDSFYQGSGALRNARRVLVVDDISYAFTREVAWLGEAGYEDLQYPGAGYSYKGPVGAVGVRLTPNRNSTLVAEYRWLDGFGSVFVQAAVQVSPRIRAYGGYSEGISTFQQDLQTSLLNETNDVTGVAAAALSASPLLQTTSFFGGNEYLSRVRRLDATATYLGEMDTAALSFEYERTTPVGHPVGELTPLDTRGYFISGTEHHQLTPSLSASVFAQYGSNRTGIANLGSGDTVSFSVSLDKVFTQTLTGYVRVGGTYVVGGSAYAATGFVGLNGEETDVTVGAVKRF